jgi:transcriptional regulator GlxA family with amidase domain
LLRARFPSGHPAVREAVALLESDVARAWTLAELGRAVHLNPRYLVAVFKRDTGLAPMEYAQRLRLERAATLLAESDDPIFRVAQRAGVQDANLFARRFRARFGCTPSQYRTRFRS